MPITMTGAQIRKHLEPGIVFPDLPDEQSAQVTQEHMVFSLALSAKRIADALEDGLTTLTDDGALAGVADIMKSMDRSANG